MHSGPQSNTPSRSDVGNTVSGLSRLYVDGALEFVMAGWEIFSEVICMIASSRFPYYVQLFLFNFSSHPRISHVEGFGQFLAKAGCEDAACCRVVCGYFI